MRTRRELLDLSSRIGAWTLSLSFELYPLSFRAAPPATSRCSVNVTGAARRSRFHEHGRPDFHKFEEQFGVPIGETEAAVGFGAADVLGARRAVDAVAGAV